jgi:hypothetical protein
MAWRRPERKRQRLDDGLALQVILLFRFPGLIYQTRLARAVRHLWNQYSIRKCRRQRLHAWIRHWEPVWRRSIQNPRLPRLLASIDAGRQMLQVRRTLESAPQSSAPSMLAQAMAECLFAQWKTLESSHVLG